MLLRNEFTLSHNASQRSSETPMGLLKMMRSRLSGPEAAQDARERFVLMRAHRAGKCLAGDVSQAFGTSPATSTRTISSALERFSHHLERSAGYAVSAKGATPEIASWQRLLKDLEWMPSGIADLHRARAWTQLTGLKPSEIVGARSADQHANQAGGADPALLEAALRRALSRQVPTAAIGTEIEIEVDTPETGPGLKATTSFRAQLHGLERRNGAWHLLAQDLSRPGALPAAYALSRIRAAGNATKGEAR